MSPRAEVHLDETLVPQSLSASLDQEVLFYRSNTFAQSTVKTYSAQKQAFFDFCSMLNIQPIPLSQDDLGRYIAYLSRRLVFSSIRQYLNVVRLLHLEAGFGNPLADNWYVSSILKGVKRVKGDSVKQKLPMTLELLSRIFLFLNLSSPCDRVFWAVCVVGFFSFFRKSNLLIPSPELFDPTRHLCATDVQFTAEGAVLSVRWSKVIQFQQRLLRIPLPKIPNSHFCPSSALLCIHLDIPHQSAPCPLFSYRTSDHSVVPLTIASFTRKLQSCMIALGIPPDRYSGHSLRRGGATFGLQCGLPVDLIKIQGDWKSNCVERYLESSFQLRKKVALSMGSCAQRFPST